MLHHSGTSTICHLKASVSRVFVGPFCYLWTVLGMYVIVNFQYVLNAYSNVHCNSEFLRVTNSKFKLFIFISDQIFFKAVKGTVA